MSAASPLEWRTGPIDWVYCPSEMFVPTRKARLAVTSHDVLQDVRFGGPRRQALLAKAFERADLVLSVSQFNTSKLLDMYPNCRGKVAYVPNAAEDLFFGEATARERSGVRGDLGLPIGLPYLISVASFQARKNLVRLVRAAGRLREVADGQLGLVLLGAGDEAEAAPIRQAIEEVGRKAVIKLPGYRQGRALMAAYAESTALVFPSTCESFGIPVVEAMACCIPVALADSTALPEIGGEAGWYFNADRRGSHHIHPRKLLDRPERTLRRGRDRPGWAWPSSGTAGKRPTTGSWRPWRREIWAISPRSRRVASLNWPPLDARRGRLDGSTSTHFGALHPSRETSDPAAGGLRLGLVLVEVRPEVGHRRRQAREDDAGDGLIGGAGAFDPGVVFSDQKGHLPELEVDDPVFQETVGEILLALGSVVSIDGTFRDDLGGGRGSDSRLGNPWGPPGGRR